MNKKQFASVLKAAIAHDAIRTKGFACYPIIGMDDSSTPDDFNAYYSDGDITVRGMFAEAITPDLVANVKRMADELEASPEYQTDGLQVAGCIIIPRHLVSKNNRASFGEHDPQSVVIFGVSIRNSLPDFTQYILEGESTRLIRY